jgi:hypothetical protein
LKEPKMSAEKETAPGPGNHDSLETRCPRLGGPVTFEYCRLFAGNNLPCWKIFDCWWEIFDVAGFLKQTLSETDFQNLADSKPKPKILSLVELITLTRKNLSMGKTKITEGEEP